MSMLGHFLDAPYLECKRTWQYTQLVLFRVWKTVVWKKRNEPPIHSSCWHHSPASTLDRNGPCLGMTAANDPPGNKWSGFDMVRYLYSVVVPWPFLSYCTGKLMGKALMNFITAIIHKNHFKCFLSSLNSEIKTKMWSKSNVAIKFE